MPYYQNWTWHCLSSCRLQPLSQRFFQNMSGHQSVAIYLTILNRAVPQVVSHEPKPNTSSKEVDKASMTIKTAKEIPEEEVCPLLGILYFTTSYTSHFWAPNAAG